MQKEIKNIFMLYHKDVYYYLYSLCKDASLAEDLTSEVFLEVIKSIGTYKGKSDFKTWLFTIARRRWFLHLRRKKKEVETQTLSDFYEDGKLIDRAERAEMAQRIAKLLESEEERTRNIIYLRIEGYSFREIGQKCGLSESSARVIYFRVKEKIKGILKEEGFWDE